MLKSWNLFNTTPFYAMQEEVALANRNILVLEDEPLVAMMPFVTGYERPPGLRYREASILRKPFTEIDLRMALISLLEKSPPGSQRKI